MRQITFLNSIRLGSYFVVVVIAGVTLLLWARTSAATDLALGVAEETYNKTARRPLPPEGQRTANEQARYGAFVAQAEEYERLLQNGDLTGLDFRARLLGLQRFFLIGKRDRFAEINAAWKANHEKLQALRAMSESDAYFPDDPVFAECEKLAQFLAEALGDAMSAISRAIKEKELAEEALRSHILDVADQQLLLRVFLKRVGFAKSQDGILKQDASSEESEAYLNAVLDDSSIIDTDEERAVVGKGAAAADRFAAANANVQKELDELLRALKIIGDRLSIDTLHHCLDVFSKDPRLDGERYIRILNALRSLREGIDEKMKIVRETQQKAKMSDAGKLNRNYVRVVSGNLRALGKGATFGVDAKIGKDVLSAATLLGYGKYGDAVLLLTSAFRGAEQQKSSLASAVLRHAAAVAMYIALDEPETFPRLAHTPVVLETVKVGALIQKSAAY